MKKKIVFLAAICSLVVVAHATTLRVNNTDSSAPYTDINDAVKAAVDGDTIMVEGSSVKYADAILDKRVVLVGPGYWLRDNGIVSESGYDARLDYLTSTAEGTDNGSVTVIAQANTTEFERTAVYTVTGNSGTAEQVNVTQLGKTVILTIEPELISATAKGRSYSFQVLGNADWTVTADVTTWLELDVRSGSGESPVRVTLSDNVTSEPRTANIHVTSSSGRHERTCVITQAGATVPSLTQPAVSGVERYAASVSSTFTSSLDATQGGFCYALTPNPTINDKSVTVDGVSGQDGQLSATLTDLVSGRTYYVRSWVRNANGIGYSSDANFTTEGKTPGENDNPTPDL